MTRLPDWERRLSDYIAAVRDRPFAFGEHDCWLFSAGAVEAITGDDPAADLRGRYHDNATARAVLRECGAGTLLKLVGQRFTLKPVGMAGRGDIVWHKGGVGVCIGAVALFVGQEGEREGLVTVARAEWQKAWAV